MSKAWQKTQEIMNTNTGKERKSESVTVVSVLFFNKLSELKSKLFASLCICKCNKRCNGN